MIPGQTTEGPPSGPVRSECPFRPKPRPHPKKETRRQTGETHQQEEGRGIAEERQAPHRPGKRKQQRQHQPADPGPGEAAGLHLLSLLVLTGGEGPRRLRSTGFHARADGSDDGHHQPQQGAFQQQSHEIGAERAPDGWNRGVELRHASLQEGHEMMREHHAQPSTRQTAHQPHEPALNHEQGRDPGAPHAQRPEDADFPSPLHDGVGHGVVDEHQPDQQPDRAHRGQVQLERPYHPLHLLVSVGRPGHLQRLRKASS